MAAKSHHFVDPTPVSAGASAPVGADAAASLDPRGRADRQGFAAPADAGGASPCAKLERGVFITFEGGDGAGKSTHISFLSSVLESKGYEVVRLREPGGTSIGEDVRGILLDVRNGQMTDECELLLYEAIRAQIVQELIEPALRRGAVVLCDRFYDSTIAYQGYGRGLDREFIRTCNHFACRGLKPDRTILMVTGESTAAGLERATRRGADRLELAGEDFHTRVNQGFMLMQEEDPQRIRLVVSADCKSVTSRRVFAQLEDLFPWMADEQACPAHLFASLDVKKVL